MTIDNTNLKQGRVWGAPVNEKSYQIKGTKYFGGTRQSLKEQRTALNLEAGVVEAGVIEKQWPFKITKGPGHPHYGSK